jgi:hypothetical protein
MPVVLKEEEPPVFKVTVEALVLLPEKTTFVDAGDTVREDRTFAAEARCGIAKVAVTATTRRRFWARIFIFLR